MWTIRGLILKERVAGENLKFADILTADEGVIEVKIKGYKKLTGSLLAATQLFSYADFSLAQTRSGYIVNSAQLQASFFDLGQDLVRFALGVYLCDLVSVLVKGRDTRQILRLLLNTLHILCKGVRSCALYKAIFEWRLLCEIGNMPDLVACSCCGCYENEQGMYFYPIDGHIICKTCDRSEGEEKRPRFLLQPSVLYTLRYITYSELEKLFRFQVSQEVCSRLAEVAEAYLLAQTERNYTSLSYYKSLLP